MKYQRGFFDFFSFIVLTSIILSCKVCLVVFFFLSNHQEAMATGIQDRLNINVLDKEFLIIIIKLNDVLTFSPQAVR